MDMPRVETRAGVVDGTETAGASVFRGIPYAAPPVGELRFRAPRPATPWTGVRPAHDFGAWSPQNEPASTLTGARPGPQSEDCLTLNVWTPSAHQGRRPVMVWIHGGGFIGGSGASPIYDGAALATRGEVVVVTVNYRLGVLGFIAHPDLADEGDEGLPGASANWGLLDQVAALRWVHDNVAAFGGDPGDVTIFGESAGAMSVADLMTVPAAHGLFHRAVAQSGPPNARPIDRAEETAAKLMAELGVGSAAGLRDVPVPALLGAQAGVLAARAGAGLTLTPVVDGVSLPQPPMQAFLSGEAARVPLVIGTNRDEAKLFMVADPRNRDPDDEVVRRRIERAFAANDIALGPDAAISGYRAARRRRGQADDPRELWSAIETDRMFRIGSLRTAEAHARHQPRTYSYLFDWKSPAMRGALGACHALEIPFVFGTLGVPTMDRFAGTGPAADELSRQMMDAWLSFVRLDEPEIPGVGAWPAYDPERRATAVFGPDTRVEDAPFEEERRVWGEAAPGL